MVRHANPEAYRTEEIKDKAHNWPHPDTDGRATPMAR
jgi:hypothetical protein